jgi:hypothetical protein
MSNHGCGHINCQICYDASDQDEAEEAHRRELVSADAFIRPPPAALVDPLAAPDRRLTVSEIIGILRRRSK